MKWLKDLLPQYAIGVGTYADGGLRIQTFRDGGNATLTIGAYCSIAAGVTVFLGGEHRHDWISTYPFPVLLPVLRVQANLQGPSERIEGHPRTKGPVTIGNDVWIGEGATILSGVTIGDGAVIGARSVVAASVPPYAKVAGNPARLIGYRFGEVYRHCLQQIAWWNWPLEKILAHVPQICSGSIYEFADKHYGGMKIPCEICQSLSHSS